MAEARIDILFGFAYDPDVRVRRTAQALAEAGYRVRILAWDRDAKLPVHEFDGPVEVERSHIRSWVGRRWGQLPFLARAVAGHVPAMRRDRPEIIHAVDLPMLLAALVVAPLVGRPRIVYDAFEIYEAMESQKYPGWLLRVIGFVERYLPRVADLVITPGEERQAYFAARGIRSVVVGNWIDPPEQLSSREAARRELGIPQDAPAILYAGGLDPSRDVRSLVRHAEAHPEHHVLIAGRGEQGTWLQGLSGPPNLHFLGWLPNPDAALAAADVLYYALVPDHPYAGHAAPNNLYTAIAYAIPIVYRAGGEFTLLAARHNIGLTFTDDSSLAAAVDELLQPDANRAIRDELRSLQMTYSWKRARASLLAAYPSPLRARSSDRP